MNIPEPLVLLAPFVVTPLAAWLSHDQFPRWLNNLIALIVILLSALAWALLSNSLAGNLVVDMVLIAGYCAALMAGPLQPLYEWLTVRLTSPLATLAYALRPVTDVFTATPPAPVIPARPTPVTAQPTAPLPVPPSPTIPARASASPGTTWVASQVAPPPDNDQPGQAEQHIAPPALTLPQQPRSSEEQGEPRP